MIFFNPTIACSILASDRNVLLVSKECKHYECIC